ncbi:hypothetical protein GLOIN_2v1835940 [Rhizophagus irregularis DAOM 181602=DAOM 197198]|uniref:Uncharacterized protein n=1 Tax=Rhizophagus irregularis (strain DAOM 181602 / DAOM 197198 / MUCL 43194) TaxID=747089 RepID=A0A2P4QR44_RHIID|nr:hypothetical protein GLOIN_2v1835940 [Rhizophagus irregularis DAOM 181602=DAOM 197198]POG80116.1 hypothetical protein GLOIN_2v1835940 [Rhizophagus irregularis DAOM 181602=DAOM 197198]GET54618.1 hypothetical protein GLOIN_2v1835940 [Rhizophagus irregularis DAOM 181602=DAOM 197198]|eukprot:XP_025186982.1 hypothetical protein GLOIN_2v1835940 [Rhizophagus irregularis DAOM 181602=DAOM 197198]
MIKHFGPPFIERRSRFFSILALRFEGPGFLAFWLFGSKVPVLSLATSALCHFSFTYRILIIGIKGYLGSGLFLVNSCCLRVFSFSWNFSIFTLSFSFFWGSWGIGMLIIWLKIGLFRRADGIGGF